MKDQVSLTNKTVIETLEKYGVTVKVFVKGGTFGAIGKSVPYHLPTGFIGSVAAKEEIFETVTLRIGALEANKTIFCVKINGDKIKEVNWTETIDRKVHLTETTANVQMGKNTFSLRFPENVIYLIKLQKEKENPTISLLEVGVVYRENQLWLTTKEIFTHKIFKTEKKHGVTCPGLFYWPKITAFIENIVKTNNFYKTLPTLTGKVDNLELALENFPTDVLDVNEAVIINFSPAQGKGLANTATGPVVFTTEVGGKTDLCLTPGMVVTYTEKKQYNHQRDPILDLGLIPKAEIIGVTSNLLN